MQGFDVPMAADPSGELGLAGLAGLRSGDGPLSVRIRSSSLMGLRIKITVSFPPFTRPGGGHDGSTLTRALPR